VGSGEDPHAVNDAATPVRPATITASATGERRMTTALLPTLRNSLNRRGPLLQRLATDGSRSVVPHGPGCRRLGRWGVVTLGRDCLQVRGDCPNTTSRPRAVVNTIWDRFSLPRLSTRSMAAPRRLPHGGYTPGANRPGMPSEGLSHRQYQHHPLAAVTLRTSKAVGYVEFARDRLTVLPP